MTDPTPPDLFDMIDALAIEIRAWAGQASGTPTVPVSLVAPDVTAAQAVVAARDAFGQPTPVGPLTDTPDSPPRTQIDLSDCADHLTVRPLVFDATGIAGVAFDFGTSEGTINGSGPRPIGTRILVSTPEVLRSAGTVVRDTCHAAAKRA